VILRDGIAAPVATGMHKNIFHHLRGGLDVISRMPIMLATIAFCALAPLGWSAESGLSGPAKFEPPDHETILIIGQTREEFGDYANTARAGQPGGYMFYTSLKHLEGLTSPWKGAGCTDAGVEDLQDWVNKYPESVGQVGLYILDQLYSINSGALDANIKTLAETLRKTNKPRWIRYPGWRLRSSFTCILSPFTAS
jgi:hypothetical protein